MVLYCYYCLPNSCQSDLPSNHVTFLPKSLQWIPMALRKGGTPYLGLPLSMVLGLSHNPLSPVLQPRKFNSVDICTGMTREGRDRCSAFGLLSCFKYWKPVFGQNKYFSKFLYLPLVGRLGCRSSLSIRDRGNTGNMIRRISTTWNGACGKVLLFQPDGLRQELAEVRKPMIRRISGFYSLGWNPGIGDLDRLREKLWAQGLLPCCHLGRNLSENVREAVRPELAPSSLS